MAQPWRIAFPGTFYHVTAHGSERKALFKSKRDRKRFLECLKDRIRKIPCRHPRLLSDGQPRPPDEFISSQKSDRNIPALKQLACQATAPDICRTADSVLGETPRLSGKVRIYLGRKSCRHRRSIRHPSYFTR